MSTSIEMNGMVMKSTGSWYVVRTEDGQIHSCRIRGKFRLEEGNTTNPVAVGDHVTFILEESDGIITEIKPRSNYIIRQSVHKKEEAHLIATNLDQAILIVTLIYPRTSLGFIDRFLVSAESFRIPQVLIFNKSDLLTNKLKLKQADIITTYEDIGIKCLITSALKDEGLQEFKAILTNKISLVAGHSGVGKSTLVNKLDPTITQTTSEVSDFAQKGVHTTTFAEMFQLSNDTFIIDTPGIKELGLVDTPPEELSDYFPEMRQIQKQCKFHNCLHLHEPKCAVKDAVDNGQITESRYASYLSMLEGYDNRR